MNYACLCRPIDWSSWFVIWVILMSVQKLTILQRWIMRHSSLKISTKLVLSSLLYVMWTAISTLVIAQRGVDSCKHRCKLWGPLISNRRHLFWLQCTNDPLDCQLGSLQHSVLNGESTSYAQSGYQSRHYH